MRATKTIELPFSEFGLTICVMDSQGNIQIKVEEPIPECFEEPIELQKRRWAGLTGRDQAMDGSG